MEQNMPLAVFDAIKQNISSFLGGASVALLPGASRIAVSATNFCPGHKRPWYRL